MLGTQIKKLRTSQNISQVELAKALNVSKQSVSNWENDNIMPSIDMLKKIAMFFSCSCDYLLDLDFKRGLLVGEDDLTMDQAAHVQKIINDFRTLNSQIKQLKNEENDKSE